MTTGPPLLTGSLPAPGTGNHSEDEAENQYPDTTTNGGPATDIPLSPIELRQLTATLGKLYNSCKSECKKKKGNFLDRYQQSTKPLTTCTHTSSKSSIFKKRWQIMHSANIKLEILLLTSSETNYIVQMQN